MKIFLWINNERDISSVLYIVPHFTPLGREKGKLIKGFGDLEGNLKGKDEKKKNLGKIKLLAVPNYKN